MGLTRRRGRIGDSKRRGRAQPGQGMVISWPVALPLPTIDGYGVHPGEAILRTEMEAGPARQRRRFTQVPSRISVRWVMRRDQFALFEAWYRWQAKEGGEWFEIELLGGLGLVIHEARFTRQFEARLSSATRWEITSELEIRERPVLTAEALEIALGEDLSGLIAAVGTLDTFVNQTLPTSPW